MSRPIRLSEWRFQIVCFVGTFFFGVACRYGLGLNFGELHLGVSERVQPQGISVSSRGLDGRVTPLQVREENSRRFSQFVCPGPIRSLLIYVPGTGEIQADDMEVRFGENWGRPSRRLPVTVSALASENGGDKPVRMYEVVPKTDVSGIFAAAGSCNWQGDFWLFAVPLLQATLLVGLLTVLRRLWVVSAVETFPLPSAWGGQMIQFASLPVVGLCFAVVRVFVLVVMFWQIWALASGFLFVRWGEQFVGCAVLLGVFSGSVGLYVRAIRSRSTDVHRLLVCGLLISAVFCCKLYFCLRFDGVQQGDYEKYYRYGLAIASGRWDLIGDAGVLTRSIFLERATVFTAPLIWVFGPSLTALELSLLAMEFGTVVGMLWLTSRMFGVSAACCSVPFLLVYPPFIFSTWVVGTTTPGFLWMVVLWCGAEKLIEYLRGRLSGRSGQPAVWCWLVSSLSFCAALVMLDLTRLFAVFVYAGAFASGAIALVSLWYAVPRPSIKPVFAVLLIGLFTLYFGSAGVRFCRGYILAEVSTHVGPTPSAPMLDAISAMDSSTNGSGVTISNWRFATLLNLPPKVRSELVRRKLIHEKLLVGQNAWFHVLRKASFLAFVQDAQNRVIGGMSGAKEGFMSWSRVPWYSTLRLFTDGFSLMLLCFGVLRCVAPVTLGVTRSELFPLSFVVILYSAIVVLLEAGPYYTYIIAFPLSWSAGLVLGRNGFSSGGVASNCGLASDFLTVLQWKRPAVVLCCAVVLFGVHAVLARALQDRGLGFLPIQTAAKSEGVADAAVLSGSRVHAAVALPATAGVVPKGRECSSEIVVPGAFRKSDRCCFLLTVDARSRNLYFPRSFWNSLPVEYVVEWEGREYLRGQLGALHPPQMFCIDASEAQGARPEDLRLRLRLHAVGEVNVRESGFLPAIAVEYPFNPDGDPRSELAAWREDMRKAEQSMKRSIE